MAIKSFPTPETLRQLLRYEPDTGKLFWLERPASLCSSASDARRWNNTYGGKEAFTARVRGGYCVGAVLKVQHYAHRVAWAVAMGEWPNGEIDHIDGDRANNRLSNLRNADSTTNNRNRKRPVHNSSGTMGVSVVAGRWQARLGAGPDRHLGAFDTYEEAVAARKQAECERGYHKNHGR